MKKSVKSIVCALILVFFVLFFSNFVLADFADCWEYSGTSNATCVDSGGSTCIWQTQAEDPWCTYSAGCCTHKSCWLYDGTDSETCLANDGTMNCTWDPLMSMWYPNGTQAPLGGCMMDWSSSNETWGGVTEGCWNYDGDKAGCGAQGGTCKWTDNDQNQDPWCWIKNLADAQNENADATSTDIGCCQTAGCWNYDSNQTACEAAYQGSCYYYNNTYGGGGWCYAKSCGEVFGEVNCTFLTQNLMMPCTWNEGGGTCDGVAGGGFSFYNDTDSCFTAGGWYNSTGSCVMPSGGDFGAGSGGFIFGEEAHCWFADNKPDTCLNISGCAYCVEGNSTSGVANTSSGNICANKPAGYCEGHYTGDTDTYDNANNSVNLNCTHIEIKTACNYGPLPNCRWNNGSATTGTHCEVGASGAQQSAPPAQYCEDPIAKNNYTVCMQLSDDFMMPCKWQNKTYPHTNCTFNNNAVFGGFGGETDFGVISSQFSCTAAGGTWQTEYYVDGTILKQDSWCEMTGFFDIDQGIGQGNKGNCNTSCWACEFQPDGSAWANLSDANANCVGSALGFCQWTNDTGGTSSFNGFGWCDYPQEMEDVGANDCSLECEGCNFMASPESTCLASMAGNGTGCKWVNDTNNDINGGFCVDKTKKVCQTDCFSCYDFTACNASSLSCNWDVAFNLCSPEGFTGEICFNGADDDSDTLIDCADPDCGFDNFCGGSSFGGDCFAQVTEGACNTTLAFGTLNCSWINNTWNPEGRCDMPGSNCWEYDNNLTKCGLTAGCTNDSSTMDISSNSWCEINWTKMDDANCWVNSGDYSSCDSAVDCQWMNESWEGAEPGSGWCDYLPYAVCNNLNSSNCDSEGNCSWREDNYSMMGGWCGVTCMNPDLDQSGCEHADFDGLCSWKAGDETCQPETFMMMGTAGSGGIMGCGQYDGNETGCGVKNVTCSYKNDTYCQNNVSADEPSGWCMMKSEYDHFGEMEGDIIQLYMDGGNVNGAAEPGVDPVVDLIGNGMRVTDVGFNFGAGIYNISKSMMCNGYMIGGGMGAGANTPVLGVGLETTKFYWYLDTNGNSSDGCPAVQSSSGSDNLTGFEFLINYVARNTSDGFLETKQLMRCSNNVNWTPTNALIVPSKKVSCGEISGVMVGVSKQDLESFLEYNKTSVMRIFIASANASLSRTNPSDSLGPGYYTPGTIDFGFIDCSNPVNAQDPKCKNFQKFGFNVFEECKNGIDDDENGLVDCDDPFCSFIPDCNSGVGFNFTANSSDTAAPVVMFSDVEKLHDAAFVRIDTSEPSNLSLDFFRNDSLCETVNETLTNVGTGYQANANFKPFHTVDLMTDNLGYNFTNGTDYYYKVTTCDPSSNCAVSACSNFTTKVKAEEKEFIFKLELPAGYTVDIPAMNKTDYNFTETFGGQVYEVGIKTNTSVTKNMNMTVHCDNMSIGFYGINMLDPTKIDLTNAFVCDSPNNLIGMNSSLKKWNKIIDDLHLGGATDYVEISIPVNYSTDNTFNWTDDSGQGGMDVDAYVNCSGNTTETNCMVPISMGFSAYTVSTPSSDDGGDGTSSGGGGGGGGGIATPNVYTPTAGMFAQGYTQVLKMKDKFKVSIASVWYEITLTNITSAIVKIEVSSTPSQTVTMAAGETKNFDVTSDNLADFSVKLNSISPNTTNASLTIKSISADVQVAPSPDIVVSEELAEEQTPTGKGDYMIKLILIVVGAVVVIFVLIKIIIKQDKVLRAFGYRKKSTDNRMIK